MSDFLIKPQKWSKNEENVSTQKTKIFGFKIISLISPVLNRLSECFQLLLKHVKTIGRFALVGKKMSVLIQFKNILYEINMYFTWCQKTNRIRSHLKSYLRRNLKPFQGSCRPDKFLFRMLVSFENSCNHEKQKHCTNNWSED